MQQPEYDEITALIEHSMASSGFPPAGGNFADHAMYYVSGLMQRGWHLELATLSSHQVMLNFTTNGTCPLFEPFWRTIEGRKLLRYWCEMNASVGMFEVPTYKRGRDLSAMWFAFYMLAQSDLLSYQPEVKRNPADQHNVDPVLQNTGRERALLAVKVGGIDAKRVVLQPSTVNPERLASAKIVREALLSMKLPIVVYMYHFTKDIHERVEVDIRQQNNIRGLFLDDMPSSAWIQKDVDTVLALYMGLHGRLGPESPVYSLNADILRMITGFLAKREDKAKRLLLGTVAVPSARMPQVKTATSERLYAMAKHFT